MRLWCTWVQCSGGALSPILATRPVANVAGFFICAISTGFIHQRRTSYAPLAHSGSMLRRRTQSRSRYKACHECCGLFLFVQCAHDSSTRGGQVIRQRRTRVQCSGGAPNPDLATKPVMKMAGFF